MTTAGLNRRQSFAKFHAMTIEAPITKVIGKCCCGDRIRHFCNYVLYCTVLYCTVLYCTVLYCTVLYCIVLYCTVLYCTVLYCTVLYLIFWFSASHSLRLHPLS